MTQRPRGDTEAPPTGLDLVLGGLFDWLRVNARAFGGALGAALVMGALVAWRYESGLTTEAAAQTAIVQVHQNAVVAILPSATPSGP